MGYVGNSPAANFASVIKDTFSGDGSTTAFTLSKAATTNGVAVFVENVRQEPTIAYAVSGTTLTFTAAPVSASGNNIYVLHHNAPASTANHPASQDLTAVKGTFTSTVDINGNELILDADADSSITADTDDQIDIKISGADDFQFTANTFTAQSGSSVVVPDGGLTFGSTAISSTAAELNKLDGATVTTAELNLIDGDTSRGTTALADGDGILINDAGTMRMTNVTAVKTYMQSGLSSDELIDADSDTKIQVEESSDEDTIRFDVAGAETATMTAKGFELTAVGGFFINQTTNSQTLTIAAAENAIMGGPVTYSGTITVEGNLSII